MTLFVKTPKRTLEISGAYLMALTFLISFAITRIFKAAIEKQKQKNLKNIKYS